MTFGLLMLLWFQTSHYVTLNWQDNQAGATYNIYRYDGACTGTPTYVKIKTGVTLKTYDDTTVSQTVGTKYCYVVTVSLNGAESVYSNNAEATIPPFSASGLQVTSK